MWKIPARSLANDRVQPWKTGRDKQELFDNLNRKTPCFESACFARRRVAEPARVAARFQCMEKRRILEGMAKPRIVVTCPQTGVTVISNIAYDDIAGPEKNIVFFACACGETHKLAFAGRHRDASKSPSSPADDCVS